MLLLKDSIVEDITKKVDEKLGYLNAQITWKLDHTEARVDTVVQKLDAVEVKIRDIETQQDNKSCKKKSGVPVVNIKGLSKTDSEDTKAAL